MDCVCGAPAHVLYGYRCEDCYVAAQSLLNRPISQEQVEAFRDRKRSDNPDDTTDDFNMRARVRRMMSNLKRQVSRRRMRIR
jgi:hypothetical protein